MRHHPEYSSINELFLHTCQKFGDKTAYEHADTKLSFYELHNKALSLAASLMQDFGINPGDRIAIMLPNCLQYPISIFASLLCGATIVNINPLLTTRELKNQLIDSGSHTIIILDYAAHTLQECLQETPIKHVIISQIGDCFPKHKALLAHMVMKYVKRMGENHQIKDFTPLPSLLDMPHPHWKPPNIQWHDRAFLQYTGGTTGTPKAAILTHRNILYNIIQGQHAVAPSLFHPGSETTVLLALPLYHIFALTVSLIGFSQGAKGLLVANPRDTDKLIKIIRSQPIHGVALIQTLMENLLKHKEFTTINWKNLRQTINGGMKTHRKTAQKWYEKTGCIVDEGYGLSETSPIIALSQHQHTFSETVGQPVLHTLVKIMKDDTVPALPQECGEIWVKGPQVMSSYWKKPQETHAAMTPDGWFKTGDIGLLTPHGEICLIDRAKDMVIISGFNVYPQEVEEVIELHPDVLECGVVGEGEYTAEVVAAYIVKKNVSCSEQEILKHCRQNLSAYKVPKKIVFIRELPKSAVGKVLRRQLPAA